MSVSQHSLAPAAIRVLSGCPVCGSQQIRQGFEVRHIEDDALFAWARQAGYTRVRIAHCRDCGFAFKSQQPAPEILERHYAETGLEYLDRLAEDDPAFRSDHRHARQFLRQRFPEGGRVLDAGCGRGFFLKSLASGWQLFGVEPSRDAADYAARQHGISVHAGDLFSAGFAAEFFDVVSLFDVVEHLSQPGRVFAEARRILKPGGWLVVGTGNWGALTARLAGRQWAYLAIPDHLSFFSPDSLRRALVSAGFSRILFRNLHHGRLGMHVASGWLRAVLRHRAISLFGPGITRLPLFRHKAEQLPVPYFWDHMLALAS